MLLLLLLLMSSYLVSQSGDERANQVDRQNFEDQAENIISKCASAVKQLKENALKQIHTPQYRDHLENVFYLLEKYLEGTLYIYTVIILRMFLIIYCLII